MKVRLGLMKLREALEINESMVVQLIRKSARRGLRLNVATNGTLSVEAPLSTKSALIKSFVLEHLDWIENRNLVFESLRNQNAPKCGRPGETWLFRGELLKLLYLRAPIERPRVFRHGAYLICEIPERDFNPTFLWAPQPKMMKVIFSFYLRQSEIVIPKRVEHFSERLGLFPRRLRFRSQRTMWGSCNSRGHLSFNFRLIAAPPHILDYVVVHELCHLQHADHSKNFWNLVATQIPDFRSSRKWLRNHQFDFDFLSKESDLYLSRI